MDAARKNAETEQGNWLSMYQAAAVLGCTRYLVAQYIGRGRLRSTVFVGRTFVDGDDVARVKAEREAEQSTAVV